MVEVDNRKPLIITIIVLAIIVVALGGFIALDKLVINKKEEQKLTTIKNAEIDLNAMYQIGEILNRMDHTFNDTNSSYLGYIYNLKKLEAKKFDPSAALFVAIHDDMIPSNTNLQLLGGYVKNNFENIFGKAIAYEPKSIDSGNYKIAYDEVTNTYSYTLAPADNSYKPKLISYNVKTIIEGEYVIVTRKVFYVEYPNQTSVNVYKTWDKQNLIGTLKLKNGILNEEEIVGKFGSKLGTYSYKFIQNAADNYTFYSIEREK